MRRWVTRHKVGSRRVSAWVPVGGSARGGSTGVGHAEKHKPGGAPRGDGAVGRKVAGALPSAPARSGGFLRVSLGAAASRTPASECTCVLRPRVCTPVRAGLRVGSPVPLWAPASPRCRSRHAGPFLRIFFSSFVSRSLALTLSGAPAVPSRAAGCWEVAWLPLRCCCARGGREGGLNAGCCARLGWGAAEKEEADDDDDGGEGVTTELTAGAQLPGEPPERPLRSPADNACSAPDTAHRGRERGQTPPPPSSPPVPPLSAPKHCPPRSN